jgi:hypothetical protein
VTFDPSQVDWSDPIRRESPQADGLIAWALPRPGPGPYMRDAARGRRWRFGGDTRWRWDRELNLPVLHFDGNGDYADLQGTAGGEVNEALWKKRALICCWAKWTSTSLNRFFGAQKTASGGYVIGINNYPSAGNMRWYWGHGTDAKALTYTGTALNDGLWHHIAWGTDATNNYLYLDGVLASSQAYPVEDVGSLDRDLCWGLDRYDRTATQAFDGQMADLRVYRLASHTFPVLVPHIFNKATRYDLFRKRTEPVVAPASALPAAVNYRTLLGVGT